MYCFRHEPCFVMKRDTVSSRRAFLEKLAALGIASLGGTAFLTGCAQKEEQPPAEQATAPAQPAELTCNDVSGLRPEELQQREQMIKTLQYVEHSPYPDKVCSNCNFWKAPPEGQQCGGCQLILGPINPNGYCTSWAPKQA